MRSTVGRFLLQNKYQKPYKKKRKKERENFLLIYDQNLIVRLPPYWAIIITVDISSDVNKNLFFS